MQYLRGSIILRAIDTLVKVAAMRGVCESWGAH